MGDVDSTAPPVELDTEALPDPAPAMEMLSVEVAYARPDSQAILAVDLPAGSSLRDAVALSGILERYPEIDLSPGGNDLGVFGKLAKADTPVRAGDRVEIYRPLIADPKEVRRQRAAAGKKMKRGGGDLEAPAPGDD